MAAYAALVSLLNNIHTIKNHPSFSTSLDDLPIQPLLEKTNYLLVFIEGNNYGGGSKEARYLERRIASAAHKAEDVIESHIVDQIHAAKDQIESHNVDQIHAGEDQIESNIVDQIREERSRRPYFMKFLLKCAGFHINDKSENSHGRQIKEDMDATTEKASESMAKRRLGKEQLPTHLVGHLIEDMDAIIKEANQFTEKHRLGEEQQPLHLVEPRVESGDTAMVGLEAEFNQLLDELTRYQSNRRIISIVGMGGMGKTTLAKHVYENLLIKEHFQFRAWATISVQHNARDILQKLLPTLGEFVNENVDDLGLKLHKILWGRRYLIVLDDIWDVKAWDEVKRFFPNNNNGSMILLTTRLSNVAKNCGSSLFMMNLLDEEESWKLFCEKAFQDKDCPPELREVGEEIVKLCKGLALSIVVTGGLLLKSPRTLRYWKTVAKSLKSIPNLKEKQKSLNVLSLSYNHLPPHLKPCFLYMGVFKEDSDIRVSKMIRLWIAEGFIKPIGSQVLEEIAEGFLNDLIDRNLVFVRRRRKNGKFGSCGIHDLLRDLCIKLAKQEEFFHFGEVRIRGTERRLANNWHLECMKVRLPLTRSIVTQDLINPPIEYRMLRVLDVAGFSLRANYYMNVNLRYLSHVHPNDVYDTWSIPTSVSLIWNLQTLIITHRIYLVLLLLKSVEIWKMGQLRHLECYRIYIPGPPQSNGQNGFLMLENLQTLKTVVNFRLCEEVCRTIPNIKKLHLLYARDAKGYDDSLIECLCNLDRLHKLESLNLYIDSDLFPNRELKRKLVASFPSSLKKLSLSECQLHWDDTTMIGSLPQLEVLKLEDLSVVEGENWSLVDGQFCHLKFLEISSCFLVSWDAENSHLPVLEKLHLCGLNSLNEIPLDIGNIPTLELIHVYNCSDSTAISAVKIKEDQLENDSKLQVQVRVSKKNAESFNMMLEMEGLTADNISLEILLA